MIWLAFLAILILGSSVDAQNCSGQLTALNNNYRVNYTVSGTSVNFIVSFNVGNIPEPGLWIGLGFSTKTVQPFMVS